MAQNMKISVVKLTGENIIVDVQKGETFAEFLSRIVRDYDLSLKREDFPFTFSGLSFGDNLYGFLNEYLTNTDSELNKSGSMLPIFEINLLEKSIQHSHSIKNEEKGCPYIETSTAEPYDVYKEVHTLDPSLIVLNQEQPEQYSVLNENIFEPTDFHSDPNKKSEENHELTLYSSDDVLIQLTENTSKPETNSGSEKIVMESNEEVVENHEECEKSNEQNYNYIDIESKLREIHEYNEESVTDLCRLCAGNVNRDNKREIYGENGQLGEKINKYLPVKVAKEDGLPQQICEMCMDRVKSYFEYAQVVIEADKILKLKFKASTEVTEHLKESSVTEFITEFLSSGNKSPVAPNKNDAVKHEPEESSEYETEYLNPEPSDKSKEAPNCRLCDLALDGVTEAVTHSINDHCIDDLFLCVLCELGFPTPDMLAKHVEGEHREFPRKNQRRFQCSVCLKKYSSQFQLQKHTCAKSSANKTLHCEICNQGFPSKVRLNFHRQFHLEEARPLFCTLCNVTFDDENEYFDHVNFLHGEKQLYTCSICGKTFNMRAAYNNHRKNHAGARNHRCEMCEKSFLDKQTLKEHEVSHMVTKPYQCHICGKNLNRLSRLRRHLLTHESNPVMNEIHVCSICNETFADEQTAKLHQSCKGTEDNICIELISTDKVFRCEFCEKCYSTPSALNEHRAVHSGPTPYVCHICRAHFSSYSRCTSHKTTHGIYKDGAEKDTYPVVKHFLCEHCGKSYLHWSYLGLHRRLKHSENVRTYKCVECNLEFPSSWSIAYHRKSKHNQEQFKCTDCNKYFSNYYSLKLHRLTQHTDRKSKDTQCHKCGKIFVQQASLEAHLKLHQGIKEYKCPVCPKRFAHPSGLSNHVKLHKNDDKHIVKHPVHKLPPGAVKPPENSRTTNSNSDRPYTCDICGLSFRKQFTLKNHRQKHCKSSDAGSFVLMVDMKEDDPEEEVEGSKGVSFNGKDNLKFGPRVQKETPEKCKIQPPEETPFRVQENYIQLDPDLANLTENYIDIGNGNFLQLRGNTVNIGGKEYILVDETEKDQQQFEMVVDDTVRQEEPAVNLVNETGFVDNNTILLVNSDNSFVVNQGQIQPDYISVAKTDGGTAYVIENHFMLETDEATL